MKSLIVCRLRLILIPIALGLWVAPAAAQVKLPKPPASYDVELRYRIRANRDERLRQFDQLEKFLARIGFQETPTEDSETAPFDPAAERMLGSIPSSTARALLQDSRIKTVLLKPAGYKTPENPEERVKVRIELTSGLPVHQQRLLHQQASAFLTQLGFREAIGYDTLGHTLLRGTVPAGSLQYLTKDIRYQPSGWLLPEVPSERLPEPFASVPPVRLVEVVPEPQGTPASVEEASRLPAIDAPPAVVAKLDPGLKRLIALEPTKSDVRVEVVLLTPPAADDTGWRGELLRALPEGRVEGQMEGIITLFLPRASSALSLAGLPFVDGVRLPRVAAPAPPITRPPPRDQPKQPGKAVPLSGAVQPISSVILAAGEVPDALKRTGLDQLHARNFRGAGVRLAIIDSDFSGYDQFVGKQLPKATKLIDLTAERNPSILPDPQPATKGIGHGTHCALAAALAAPAAEFTLIRVDPAIPYQLFSLAHYMLGDPIEPEAFRARRAEIEAETAQTNRDRIDAEREYRRAFEQFSDEPEARQARRAAQQKLADLAKKDKELFDRTVRLNQLEADLIALRGTQVIANPFVWNSGSPLEANSALSRYLNEHYVRSHPPLVDNPAKRIKRPLWFQAAGDTRGQSWTGTFLDVDGDGVMEFAPENTAVPAERWTRELNFLRLAPPAKDGTFDLPEGAHVRISIQWREPHDPDLSESYYREPVAPLRLALLHQRDPNGATVPSDEMEVVARSDSLAQRLVNTPNYGIYEQVVETTLPVAGRYALRVEGSVPRSLRPGYMPIVPALEQEWELRPRIFIETLEGISPEAGRVVFGDYAVSAGGVGMPADSRGALTIGAANLEGKPEPFSAIGAGPAMELRAKPDLWAYDDLGTLGDGTGPARGTALSTSFAAGMSATLLSAGASQTNFLKSVGIPCGYLFEVPERWIMAATLRK
jgi:hypothetical protein